MSGAMSPGPLHSEPDIERLDRFDGIFVRHDMVDYTERRILDLMYQTQATTARNDEKRRALGHWANKQDELWLLPIVGPSGSTKSKTIQWTTDRIYESRKDENSLPLLVVTLRSAIRSTRALQASILEAFHDPSAGSVLHMKDYSEAAVNAAIMNIARKRGTSLVVFDEAHNVLSDARSDVMARAMKSLINDGVFSIALAGTDDLLPLLHHQELAQRAKEPIWFKPATTDQIETCSAFFAFVEELCDQMLKEGAIALPFRPTSSKNQCALLFDMCEGSIGRAVRVIRRGLERSVSEGHPSLSWDTVIAAHTSWQTIRGGHKQRFAANSATRETMAMLNKLQKAS
ncbi:ATP-binding protein [uncultured Devosia sp.]|uniref:ATP-binding protein n=1 Tax=uncultured Devosia sp. TaxID=211434 RepID=UPI002619A4F6|nr:ATP-binding protein [uncultured Devosia sp.]